MLYTRRFGLDHAEKQRRPTLILKVMTTQPKSTLVDNYIGGYDPLCPMVCLI